MVVSAQEYLKLSDVYKMYGSGYFPTQAASSAPNSFCLPLAVTPDAPREVWLLQSFIFDRILSLLFYLLFSFPVPFISRLLLFSALMFHDAARPTHWLSCFKTVSFFLSTHLLLLYPLLLFLCFCIPTMPSLHSVCMFVFVCWEYSDRVKEYVTVSQLNQLFGMPKVDSSPSSSVQSFQAIVADPVMSSHTSQCGSSQLLPVEVCGPIFPGVFGFIVVFRCSCCVILDWFLKSSVRKQWDRLLCFKPGWCLLYHLKK